jgi:hypothetical protein
MADKDSSNNQSWVVPVVVAVIGAISTIAVAWLSRPLSSPPAIQTSSPTPSIAPSQEASTALSSTGSLEQSVRLTPDQIKALLVGRIEQGRLIEPSNATTEGNAGTWYNAYYYSDNTMLYRRSASETGSERWIWVVEENGSLCRGPGPTKAEMSCRSVESVGDDRYRGVGFRSGEPRYEFTVRPGNAEELQ